MKIVTRIRLASLATLAVGHAGVGLLFPAEQADLLIVLAGVNAVLFFVAAPLFAEHLFRKDLERLNAFIDEIKAGNFATALPVGNETSETDGESEFNRLRRSLNWMARQIQFREGKIREELENVESLNQRLKVKAVTDQMTGLHNYEYFWSQIGISFARFRKERRHFCFVMADIDFFKKVNDEYGHPMGDVVLKGLADLLRGRVRETDVVARLGGEEFGIILNDAGAREAETLLNRLQDAIRETAFPLDDGRILKVTMSMGYVAVDDTRVDSTEDIVKKADDALYFVKRNGRDGVMNWARIAA